MLDNSKRKIIMDMEANNLYPAVTVLHCAVAIDLITSEVFEFRPDQMSNGEFVDFLDSCDFIACHNGIGFDFPAIEKVLGWVPEKPEHLFDTLVMSRTLSPDRQAPYGSRFPHSVDSWGRRFGIKKPEYEQWETYDEEMMHRCSEDTRIQTMMFKVLCQEAGFDIKYIDPRDTEGYRKGEPNWSESLYNEHRSSEIMFKQEMNGCYFNFETALEYIETLNNFAEEKSEYILRNIPIHYEQYGVSVTAPFKMNGDYKKMTLDWYEDEAHLVSGPFSRINECSLNLNSAKQLKEWLYSIGWVPDEWNYKKNKAGRLEKDGDGNLIKTSPKITQSSLDVLDGYLGECISSRNKANHKRNQLQGLCDRTDKQTMRIPAGANPQGTPTARMKHRGVANIPKASSYENKEDKNDPRNGDLLWFPEKQDPFFGTEMRSVFEAPEGKVLVGRDAAGLEFRCFAHYVGDEELIDVILNQDIHTYNQIKAGLPTRSIAKTFIYAFLFGAGNKKLGSIVMPHGTEEQQRAAGAAAKENFLKAIPKLEQLITQVQKASRRGWLRGLDGRCMFMRKSEDGRIQANKALNVLCQGAGAVIMTRARIWVWDEIEKRGWIDSGKAIKVLDYHDEETWECDPDIAEQVADLLVQSIIEAGLHYNLKIPLDADAQIGKTWAEIH